VNEVRDVHATITLPQASDIVVRPCHQSQPRRRNCSPGDCLLGETENGFAVTGPIDVRRNPGPRHVARAVRGKGTAQDVFFARTGRKAICKFDSTADGCGLGECSPTSRILPLRLFAYQRAATDRPERTPGAVESAARFTVAALFRSGSRR
jgi:hypothetical protein